MKKFSQHKIGIDQGDTVLFSDYEHDGIMWTGDGARRTRLHVQFSESFANPPMLQLAMTMWDMSNTANARADVKAEDITNDGFVIVFRTWSDTKVARVRVGWQAIGEVRDDEDWDIT